MLKGTKVYSLALLKCPHCHEGAFFKSHPYDLKQLGEINDQCPVCEESNKGEAGFYYGAMYVSYGLGVGMFVGFFVFLNVLFPSMELITQFFVMGIVIVLLAPWTYALSKIAWANMFMHYKKK